MSNHDPITNQDTLAWLPHPGNTVSISATNPHTTQSVIQTTQPVVQTTQSLVSPDLARSGGYPQLGGAFDRPGVIKVQPWLNLEAGTGAGSPYEIIQPASRWLRGESASTYHLKIQISYLSAGCTLYLESSTTPEGPWAEVQSFTSQTDTMIVISSEGGDARFSGFVRWRVSGNAPWQICFQIEGVPGSSMAKHVGIPRKV